MKTVFVGVIPNKLNLNNKPFRTDIGGSYHTELASAKYQCEINGGRSRYFFIEERYWIDYPGTDKPSHVGNIKQIHHFNKDGEITYGKTNTFREEQAETTIAIIRAAVTFARFILSRKR